MTLTPWLLEPPHWRPQVVATLMFVVQQQQILLIHKQTGHGAGKVNGPGGKLEPGESVVACAIRECEEETGIRPLAPMPLVELRFADPRYPDMLGYGFLARQHTGTLRASREAEPFWCDLAAIPYADMWPDDALWLPRLLAEQPCRGDFVMQDEQLLRHRLAPLPAVVLQQRTQSADPVRLLC